MICFVCGCDSKEHIHTPYVRPPQTDVPSTIKRYWDKYLEEFEYIIIQPYLGLGDYLEYRGNYVEVNMNDGLESWGAPLWSVMWDWIEFNGFRPMVWLKEIL